MVARPSKFMCLNFVSAVSLLFFYPSWSERCSGSCKLHVSQLCQRTFAKLSVVPEELMLHMESGASVNTKIPEMKDTRTCVQNNICINDFGFTIPLKIDHLIRSP